MMNTSCMNTMVYHCILQVTAKGAEETNLHARRSKACSESLISGVKNIWFPHASSVRDKMFMSVTTFETPVRNRRKVFPYNVNETPVKNLKKMQKLIKRV